MLFLDYYLVDFDTASTTLEAPFCLVAALIYLIWAFRFPLKEAVYCTVWIYMITEFMTQVTMPLTDKLCRNFTGIVRYGVMACVYLGCILLGYILVNKYLAATLQVNEHYHVGRQKLLVSVFAAAVYMVVSNYQFIFCFAKTGIIEPGESETVTVTFNTDDLASYDYCGYGWDTPEVEPWASLPHFHTNFPSFFHKTTCNPPPHMYNVICSVIFKKKYSIIKREV